MKDYVKDRHKAFADVLYSDDFNALDSFCKKYGIPKTEARKVQKAGVLKAILECVDFSEDEKNMATVKCIEMGFNPFIKPYDYDREV